MTSPIDASRTTHSIPRPEDESRDQPSRSTAPARGSVADSWDRFEKTGQWADRSTPDDACLDEGARAYDRCDENAKLACNMFPALATVSGGGVGRMGGAVGAFVGGAAGTYVGERMKEDCFFVSEVQCRYEESGVIDACMDARAPSEPKGASSDVPHFVPEDFPVAADDSGDVPHYAPEDFPAAEE